MAGAGLAYPVGSFTLFHFPAYASAVIRVYIAPLVGELAFCIWLLAGGPVPSQGGPDAAARESQ